MTPAEKLLAWFLRGTAVLLLSAALAVVMPFAWMNAVHAWFGLGELPDLPIIGYLTRSLSAVYAVLGVACWCCSRVVRQALPLLEMAVPLSLVFALIIILIDVLADMPTLWTLVEGPFLLVWTVAFWCLVRRASRREIG